MTSPCTNRLVSMKSWAPAARQWLPRTWLCDDACRFVMRCRLGRNQAIARTNGTSLIISTSMEISSTTSRYCCRRLIVPSDGGSPDPSQGSLLQGQGLPHAPMSYCSAMSTLQGGFSQGSQCQNCGTCLISDLSSAET
jgi:hypothetical protein